MFKHFIQISNLYILAPCYQAIASTVLVDNGDLMIVLTPLSYSFDTIDGHALGLTAASGSCCQAAVTLVLV